MLRRTILDNPDVDPLDKEAILRSMYVDDPIQSVCSKDDVYKIIIGVPALLHHTGGFELTKFVRIYLFSIELKKWVYSQLRG